MFKVEITEITVEEVFAGKEWKPTGKKDEHGVIEHAYTPEITKKKKVERKVYEQTVDKMNIRRVIEAVNSGLDVSWFYEGKKA